MSKYYMYIYYIKIKFMNKATENYITNSFRSY